MGKGLKPFSKKLLSVSVFGLTVFR